MEDRGIYPHWLQPQIFNQNVEKKKYSTSISQFYSIADSANDLKESKERVRELRRSQLLQILETVDEKWLELQVPSYHQHKFKELVTKIELKKSLEICQKELEQLNQNFAPVQIVERTIEKREAQLLSLKTFLEDEEEISVKSKLKQHINNYRSATVAVIKAIREWKNQFRFMQLMQPYKDQNIVNGLQKIPYIYQDDIDYLQALQDDVNEICEIWFKRFGERPEGTFILQQLIQVPDFLTKGIKECLDELIDEKRSPRPKDFYKKQADPSNCSCFNHRNSVSINSKTTNQSYQEIKPNRLRKPSPQLDVTNKAYSLQKIPDLKNRLKTDSPSSANISTIHSRKVLPQQLNQQSQQQVNLSFMSKKNSYQEQILSSIDEKRSSLQQNTQNKLFFGPRRNQRRNMDEKQVLKQYLNKIYKTLETQALV